MTEPKKRPVGRPPLPKSRKRQELHTSVTPDTLREIKRRARAEGLNPGQVIDRAFLPAAV